MVAIIITVHGTNDTAPSDEGEQWWQLGSAFQDRLLARCVARGEDPIVRPFRWDGANSDVARRRAGARLAGIVRRAIRQAETVSLVGHSHGGNVIAYALEDPELASAYRHGALRVVSVGTPFFAGRPRRVSIVNEIARRTILSLVLLLLLAVGMVLSGASAMFVPPESDSASVLDEIRIIAQEIAMVGRQGVDDLERLAQEQAGPELAAQITGVLDLARFLLPALQFLVNQPGLLMIACVAGLFATHARGLYWLARRALTWLRTARMRRENTRAGAWTAIAHPADEAIALLTATPRAKLSPMTAQGAARSVRRLTPLIALIAAAMATGFIWTRAGVYVLSLPSSLVDANMNLIALQIWSNEAAYLGDIPADWSPERGYIVDDADIVRAAGGDAEREVELRERVTIMVSRSENISASLDAAVASVELVLMRYMAAILALLTALALLAIWLMQLVVVATSPLFGRALSFFANRSVTGAMTGAALGEDGEYVLKAVTVHPPARFSPRVVELSEATIEQMYVDADRNAGESLRRLRRTIHSVQQTATGDALGDMLTHISWRELIHTSYFEVDEVVEIIAEAVAP